MRQRHSSKVALSIGTVAVVVAFVAFASMHPPAVRDDEMALPDRPHANIAHAVAKKVMDEFAALANPEQPQADFDYDIESVRNGESDVPQVFLASLPNELNRITQAPERKDRFLTFVLPLILKANEEISADRKRLLAIVHRRKAGLPLSAEDQAWLAWTADRYDTSADDLDELVRRVDIIPPSLALAQAAEESGWGTSRFAHQGNALFGQRTYSDDSGLAPDERDDDDGFRVRAYNNLSEAVRSYARNLNTHPAYERFRAARARHRAEGTALAGHELASTLARYSERGAAYVASLRAIIRLNRLEPLDKARLVAADSLAKL